VPLAAGADYAIFGTVFRSQSKRSDATVAGLERLRAAVAISAVPVLAIGGVSPSMAAACRAAGAAGVAAIGAFFPAGRRSDALGPAEAVLAFQRAWGAAPNL
jgi:thiamine-phosphate pyrophosphorylase